ncbi:hypothetical protein ACWEJ6_52550 [Nonomuraea sp. NPDC004702]
MDSRSPKGRARPTAPTPLMTALLYASWGWPIMAGTHITASGCSCGDELCGAPGRHPDGQQRPSVDPDALRARWTINPGASVLARVGVAFDTMSLSEAEGLRLLRAWDQAKMPPGAPMLLGDDDLLVFTQPEPLDPLDPPVEVWLPLPALGVPSWARPSTMWAVPATSVNVATLPTAEEVRRILNGGRPSAWRQGNELRSSWHPPNTRPTACHGAGNDMATSGPEREIG